MDATASAAASAASRGTAAQPRATTAAPGDYDMFLRMLTVQMQNQDPLNPIDSADYAVQLATFSGVEQQTRTNQLLETLAGRFDLLGLSELAGWVGNEARAAVPVAFDGETPVALALSADPRADRAVLVVRDRAGAVVAREEVAPATASLGWSGQDAGGAPLPPGTYALTLESHAAGEVIATSTPQSWSRIAEVVAGADGPRLILAGGAEVAASAVSALRPAS